jgi:hypothetical protein
LWEEGGGMCDQVGEGGTREVLGQLSICTRVNGALADVSFNSIYTRSPK